MEPTPDVRPRLRWALLLAAPALVVALWFPVASGRLLSAGLAVPVGQAWFDAAAAERLAPCPRDLTHRGNLRLLVYLPACEGPPQYRGGL